MLLMIFTACYKGMISDAYALESLGYKFQFQWFCCIILLAMHTMYLLEAQNLKYLFLLYPSTTVAACNPSDGSFYKSTIFGFIASDSEGARLYTYQQVHSSGDIHHYLLYLNLSQGYPHMFSCNTQRNQIEHHVEL